MNRILTLCATLVLPCAAGEVHDAAAKGDAARIKALLAKDRLLVHARDFAFRQTPLHVAANAGHVDAAMALVMAGADLDAGTANGDPPVLFAALPKGAWAKARGIVAQYDPTKASPASFAAVASAVADAAREEGQNTRAGRMAVLRLLVERGAKTEWEYGTLLHQVALAGDGTAAAFLLENGIKANVRDDGSRTPLHFAAGVGSVDVATALIERGANVNALDNLSQTPLHSAAIWGHLPVVDLLLARKAIVDAERSDGWTALRVAAVWKHTAVALRLLEAGADVRTADKAGWTPLHGACSSGSREITEALLARGAPIEARDDAGFTPLMNALENAHMEIAELLLAKGADVKVKTKDERTALHHFCNSPVKPEWVERVIALGVAVNAKDSIGNTPLIVAAGSGHPQVVETLIRHGADVNAASKNGTTPLLAAGDFDTTSPKRLTPAGAVADYDAVCRLLIESGARVDAKNAIGLNLLIGAASKGSVALVHLALDKGLDANSSFSDGKTALHLAAKNGRAEAAELLLKNGARVDAPENDGQTPLHYAAWKAATPEIFDLLKKHGANVNARATGDGRTPLTQAAGFDNVVAIRRLLALGANPNLPDGDGNTPLHLGVNICDAEELGDALLGKGVPGTRAAWKAVKITPQAAAAARAVHARALATDRPARNLEIVRLLLEAGASPTVKAKDGRTPLDAAVKVGTPEIVRLLKNPPAKMKPHKP